MNKKNPAYRAWIIHTQRCYECGHGLRCEEAERLYNLIKRN
jgi:hypothetical protein